MINGVSIKLGDGQEWIVPPLTLTQLLHYLPQLQELAGLSPSMSWAALGAEKIEVLVEIINAALGRNYPSMSSEKVKDLVDLGNLTQVVQAVMKTQSPPVTPQAPRAVAEEEPDSPVARFRPLSPPPRQN